tara:strand:- start:65 stop:193 length:129 start_codon:yes stop_codon:yes gene_type:complete
MPESPEIARVKNTIENNMVCASVHGNAALLDLRTRLAQLSAP